MLGRGVVARRTSPGVLAWNDRIDAAVWHLPDWGGSGYWHLSRRVGRHGMRHVSDLLLVAPSSDTTNTDSRNEEDPRAGHWDRMRMTASNHSAQPRPGERFGVDPKPVARPGWRWGP